MQFGFWESSIHDQPEQAKRIASARKMETSPSIVDRENRSAVFKGSGKSPYTTTLDACTCGDYMRRRLPCKHIYRLALEVGAISGNFSTGRNRNELLDLFSMPPQSQEILYDICWLGVYRNRTVFFSERNEFSELLFTKGYCVEAIINDSSLLEALTAAEIKEILFELDIPTLPPRSSQKKTFIKWIRENEATVYHLLNKHFIVLELEAQIDPLKHTIVRRYEKKFIREEVLSEEMFLTINVIRVFTQE